MGAYSFSIPSELLINARKLLGCRLFFETGTYLGNSSLAASEIFEKVITIEYSAEIRASAISAFVGTSNIESLLGDSPHLLSERNGDYINTPTCFWLDAHWCASPIDVGSPGQTRIIEELASIGHLNSNSCIFIDDARYYLSPPPLPNRWEEWPGITEVAAALYKTSDDHFLFIYNDVICYFPKSCKREIIERLMPTLVDPSHTLRTINCLIKKTINIYVRSPRTIIKRVVEIVAGQRLNK